MSSSASLSDAFSVSKESSAGVPSSGSVTRLIRSYQQGNEEVASKLWELYFGRILGLARRQLGKRDRGVYDEEDIALSAFKSVFFGMDRRRAPADFDRDSFWSLVATVTLRKVYDRFAFDHRKKRNPLQGKETRRVRLDDPAVVQSLLSRELPPGLSLEMDDHFSAMFGMLPKEELKKIVVLKLEGYTNQEIAAQLGRGLSSIERKLKSIREIWSREYLL